MTDERSAPAAVSERTAGRDAGRGLAESCEGGSMLTNIETGIAAVNLFHMPGTGDAPHRTLYVAAPPDAACANAPPAHGIVRRATTAR